jgi:DNA helicase HerA-like ATPase
MLELFPKKEVVGVFRGFRDGAGLEFHADLALPYRSDFHNIPMHGHFVVVQLESPNEAVLGRITSLSSEGKLSSQSGEQFNVRAVQEDRPIPEELRREYLKYRVDIRMLGVLRQADEDQLVFIPSHRRLPHVGSPVAFLSPEVLRHVVGHYGKGAELGFFALGEFVYASGDNRFEAKDGMQIKEPAVVVRFPVEHLASRRTFVFARAGFGKSNLNKLLFSKLYMGTPTVEKRGGRQVPVGTVIFDPEGEYFWPDDKGRPGLCDVPELKDQVVVFTSKEPPSGYYGSFVAGGIKLDIRRLRPGDVISIGLSPEKQDQQNVRKLRGMNMNEWAQLVDLIDTHGNSADLDLIQHLLHLQSDQQAEALAARANMTSIVRMLHDRSSLLMDILLEALSEGKLCIVDVSQLRGGPSLILSGLILRRIFDRNQDEFTKAEPRTIPTIAVVEEAQSVLDPNASASGPYIEWVKEGRKYDLGAVMITQQPGSISTDILSQGDNWFLFHLLSAADLHKVQNANAHFSADILSALLNEPIPGQGVFWSSVGDAKYPIYVRVLSFEAEHRRQDERYSLGPLETYASRLRKRFDVKDDGIRASRGTITVQPSISSDSSIELDEAVDPLRIAQERAIESVKENEEFQKSISRGGIPWGRVLGLIKAALPTSMDDRDTVAYSLVPEAMNRIFAGSQGEAWETERRGPKNTLFIIKKVRA